MDTPRQQRTSAATYQRRLTKWRRWSLELTENGFNGGQPISEPVSREDKK